MMISSNIDKKWKEIKITTFKHDTIPDEWNSYTLQDKDILSGNINVYRRNP